MKIKTVTLDGKTYAELNDQGQPIYVHDDGKELPFDAAATMASLNSRIQQNQRVEAENKELKGKLAAFEGIEDAAAAQKALKIVKDLDEKKLIDAGEVDKVKAGAQKAFEERLALLEEKYKPVVAERDKLQNDLFEERLGGAFSRSQFIQDKLAVPFDIVQARFGKAFKIDEHGQVYAIQQDGNKIYSRAKPGEVASFDEALEILIDSYPGKDNIIKGGGRGTGGVGAGNGGLGEKMLTRDQFLALGPHERATKMAEGFKVVEQ